ncbi:MAG: phosphoesterase [Armatimonadetes bacterium]|nr:phosphoesterase [Armatimonadota bacterium]
MSRGHRLLVGISGLFMVGAMTHGDDPKVGEQTREGTRVSTGQFVPTAANRIQLANRPVDMVISSDLKFGYVKHNGGLTSFDLRTFKKVQDLPISGGASWYGLDINSENSKLLYTNSSNKAFLVDVNEGKMSISKEIVLPAARVGGNPYPCGIAFASDEKSAFVCLNRDNSVAQVTLDGFLLHKYDTDIAPYSVRELSGKLLVTCWSIKPKRLQETGVSSGSKVPVDTRGVALNGSLYTINLQTGELMSYPIGLQPTEIIQTAKRVFVPCSSSDVVKAFDPQTFNASDISIKVGSWYGAGPSAIAVDPAKDRMYVACGSRNSILVVKLSNGQMLGEIATEWYPTSVKIAGKNLLVTCSKGLGERNKKEEAKGHSVYDFTGSIIKLPLASKLNKVKVPPSLEKARDNVAPQPIPQRLGEPGLIKHVVYVIKENRTYDQVFGDVKTGDGDPSLCSFPKLVTPNHHALAERYGLLDNYYCNGVLSADGHTWATEGITTTQLERSFGGWTRSYPYGGDDALAVSQEGYIWDALVNKGIRFRNYGEFDTATVKPKATFKQLYDDWANNTGKYAIDHQIYVRRMREHSNMASPGWNMEIPDQIRANCFIEDFKKLDAEGKAPEFMIVYLPQDHTSGASANMPTPRAHVADNDLALGRVVEAISESSIWKSTAIFVTEDDPQAGFDHIDGHRSLCLVISPYTAHRGTVSKFFNQSSVLRTIGQVFGTPPMNFFDALATPMAACFGTKPDFAPYSALPSNIPLDELNPSSKVALNLSKPDLVNENLLNRQIWASVFPDRPYPAEYAGAHGKGLAKKGLLLDDRVREQDEDDD